LNGTEKVIVKSRSARTRDSKCGRARSWVACIVLAASLWRAPVPWIHKHEAAAADGSTARLAWHLRNFHGTGPAQKVSGWHVHLTFPWNVLNEPLGDEDADAPKPNSVYEMPFVVSAGVSVPDSDCDTAFSPLPTSLLEPGLNGCVDLHATSVAGLHFLQTFPPRVPLRALICVALC
jgi:hypothetical protein